MADNNYDPDRLQTERPGGVQFTRVTPTKPGSRKEQDKNSSGDDGYNPSLVSPTMAKVLDHIKGGESGGRYNVVYGGQTFDTSKGHPRIAVPITSGPNKGRTSSAAGAYQFIGSTWDEVADKTGRHDFSKDSQDANAVQLAKDTYKKQTGRDLEKDWDDPSLRKGIDRALGTQWESLAAGPRVSNLDVHGNPRLGFGFSDYAMREHQDRPDTSVLWMSPEDYLDLSPKMEGKPFQSPSGRSLMKSFQKGDQIESIPSLDVNVNGNSANVTEQDGRHRALLAQQEGQKEIPVAIRGIGDNQPTEIMGMNGNKRPLDLPKPRTARQEAPEQQKEPISLLQQIGDAIVPKAEAAEAPDWAREDQPATAPDWAQDQPAQQAPPAEQKPVAQMSQEEAQAANLTPDQQREWIDAQNGGVNAGKLGGAIADAAGAALIPGSGLVAPHLGSSIINPDNAAAAARGLAPYAAGAGVGAAAGSIVPGVGTGLGAAAGAGAVGLDQLATGLAGLQGPQDATNKLLDALGVRPSVTPMQRIVQQMTGGAAAALTGANAAGLLAATMRTPASKVAANWLMNKSGSVNNTVKQIAGELAKSPGMQTVSGAFSGAAAQVAAEAGLPDWMQKMVGMAAGLMPGAKGMQGNWRQINASPQAKAAIDQGFVIPPADASAGHIGEFNATNALAAEAGKVKSQQLASAHNQVVVDQKVAQEFGLPPDTEMTSEVYKQIRAREGQVYKDVENALPEIDLGSDPAFAEEVSGIGKPSESTERNFPSTKAPPGIAALKSELTRNARAPTGDVMKYAADLRSRATENIRAQGEGAAMAHRMGFAEREAADALENAMERSIQNAPQYYRQRLVEAQKARDDTYRERAIQGLPLQGDVVEAADNAVQNWSDKLANANAKNQSNQTLLDRFKQARTMMAKSYDAESVTNPSNGHVSATGLGRLKIRGKPLSGNLDQIADAANNFRKAFQNPAAFGGVEPLSILDMGFAASQGAKAMAHAASGNIGAFLAHLAAGLGPMARPFTRARILSPEYQRQMVEGAGPRAAAPLGAFTGALLPTQPTGSGAGTNALLGLTTQQ